MKNTSKFLKGLLAASPILLLGACTEAPQESAEKMTATEEPAKTEAMPAPVPVAAPAPKADAAAYETALAAATAAADKAASVKGEWRDTRWAKSTFVSWTDPEGNKVKGSYVDIAKKAAAAGDYDKAVELLEVAKFQGDMGYAQAMEQKDASPMIGAAAVAAAAAADAAESMSYDELLKATTEAVDKAASVGGEWRDTRWAKSTFVKWTNTDGSSVKGSYMGIAEKAAAAGKYDKAVELLKTAKFQAEMGYQQAMEQKNAGPRL